MKPFVYIAGPMSGKYLSCVREMIPVQDALHRAGLVTFAPQLSVLRELITPATWEEYLEYDLDIIAHCDGLVRLPGDSKGADREVEFARKRMMPIWHLKDIESHQVPSDFVGHCYAYMGNYKVFGDDE